MWNFLFLLALALLTLRVNTAFIKSFTCGQQLDGITTPGHIIARYLDLSCVLPGATISSVDFASYGTLPQGVCGSYSKPTCDAVNTLSVVTSSCRGHQKCRIWPNTTTFGDPCFGTPKELTVQFSCTEGPGTALPGCDASQGVCPPRPTPPRPPPAPINTDVMIDWEKAPSLGKITTVPSLQVVAHGALMRDSPIHDRLFDFLRDLGASRVRYVPWLPTPRLGVAELDPPTATKTSWNFTLLDEQFMDVWDAVATGRNDHSGDNMIPNFSTPPTWLYDDKKWGYNTECTSDNHCTYHGYERGTAPASAHGGLQALGDYYGRLLSWYTRGGFTDELGVEHKSGLFLNITTWEVYNEPDYGIKCIFYKWVES